MLRKCRLEPATTLTNGAKYSSSGPEQHDRGRVCSRGREGELNLEGEEMCLRPRGGTLAIMRHFLVVLNRRRVACISKTLQVHTGCVIASIPRQTTGSYDTVLRRSEAIDAVRYGNPSIPNAGLVPGVRLLEMQVAIDVNGPYTLG